MRETAGCSTACPPNDIPLLRRVQGRPLPPGTRPPTLPGDAADASSPSQASSIEIPQQVENVRSGFMPDRVLPRYRRTLPGAESGERVSR